jgi:hypothetical protein
MAGDESGSRRRTEQASVVTSHPGSCATRQSLPQFAVLRVKKIVFPYGENAGEPLFAGPDTTPGAKICGVGGDEVDPDKSWGDIATQAVVQSDVRRVRVWRCSKDMVRHPKMSLRLIKWKLPRNAFIPAT